ncbi:RNA-binding domain-containing protein [Flavobacterium sp. 102]|uniref:RNA-binding domain-containing protein n=1 Tax=Flavobacterium sp. 102 TaxID=2135623 RepID=UPI000EB50F1C|nr:RNA-binding domain-containing protein [Flavobacterium sp. 102]RKS03358.1 ATP-dependent DNA helicase RecG [Flavobacterium sp. 102]
MNENDFIESILQEKEGVQLSLFSHADIEIVGQSVCAFLNTNGGRIIVGVDHDKQVSPLNNLEEAYNALRYFIYNEITPQSLIGIRKEQYQNGTVILIEVIEGNKKPYSIKGRSYVRIGNETVTASDNDMSVLIRTNKIDDYTWEKTPDLEATIEDLNKEQIYNAIDLANKMGRVAKFSSNDPVEFLTRYQLFRNSKLTNAAIVLFAKDPTYFLPQCRVRIIDFGLGKTGNRYENIVLIEENLFKTYTEIQNYFRKNLPIISDFSEKDWKRNDDYKYPLEALDEAVINALMHRDYSDSTGEVLIGIYPDKIEIINSGKLLLSDKDLKKTHSSNPPNPVLTHIVFLCGIIEKVGRGTILINESFDKRNLESPTWVNKNGAVILTLHSTPKKIELNNRMEMYLDQVGDELFTREDYMNYFENPLSERTARLDIQKLQEIGLLQKIGDGSVTRYKRTSKELPDNAG